MSSGQRKIVATYQDVLLCVLSPFIGKERSVAVQTFVQNDTDAPPVAATIVRGPLHHLRGHVLAGSHDRLGRRPHPASIPPLQQGLAITEALLFVLVQAHHDVRAPFDVVRQRLGVLSVLLVTVYLEVQLLDD